MPANSQEIVQQIRTEFEAMLTDLIQTNPEQVLTADAIERNLWQQMLALGCSCMALFLVRQAEAVAPPRLTTQEGQTLPSHDDKERTYHWVFGEIRFARRYYYRPGSGAFALDAALNLPPEATSDLLREWQERLGVYLPYHQADAILESLLFRPFSSRLLQEALLADAAHVQAFYQQADARLPDKAATMLVVQADGKGIPLVTDPIEAPVRRSKGQKPCRKKEAILTSVYTLAPTPRTPERVVASLFHPTPPEDALPRPKPHNKWLWATRAGKEVALAFTAKQVPCQNGTHIRHRVALTDGSEALQTRTKTQFPDFTLVLDLIHADEYLWKAANALLGETALERTAWVEARTLQMRCGQTATLVSELRQIATRADLASGTRKTLLSVAAYYRHYRE